MIKAKDLKKLVRYKLQDNNEILFSDYDIKIALNEALRYISQSQAMQNSDFLETCRFYENEGFEGSWCVGVEGINLPDDFCTLAGVTDAYGRDLKPVDITHIPKQNEYKIMGNKIYVGVPAFKLTYKQMVEEIHDIDEDYVDLPSFCTDFIVKVTCMILNNAETDIMLQQIESLTKSIIPRRRYNGAEIKMPFYV